MTDPAFRAYSAPQAAAAAAAYSPSSDSPRYPYRGSYALGGAPQLLERRGGGGDVTDEGFTVVTPRFAADVDPAAGRGQPRGFIGSFLRAVGISRDPVSAQQNQQQAVRGVGISSAREAAAILQQRRLQQARRGVGVAPGAAGPRRRFCGCCSVSTFVCCLVAVVCAGLLLWLATILRVVGVAAPSAVPPAAAPLRTAADAVAGGGRLAFVAGQAMSPRFAGLAAGLGGGGVLGPGALAGDVAGPAQPPPAAAAAPAPASQTELQHEPLPPMSPLQDQQGPQEAGADAPPPPHSSLEDPTLEPPDSLQQQEDQQEQGQQQQADPPTAQEGSAAAPPPYPALSAFAGGAGGGATPGALPPFHPPLPTGWAFRPGAMPPAYAAAGAEAAGCVLPPSPVVSGLAIVAADRERMEAVRGAFLHSWRAYEAHAWGADTLKPVSQRADNDFLGMGISITDSLSTLAVMGLDAEFAKAADWVASSLHFDAQRNKNVFEATIRVIGGLISAWALSGRSDARLIAKAVEAADALTVAFDASPSGVPYSTVDFPTRRASNPGAGGMSSISEVATLQLEWEALSAVTGDPQYAARARRVIAHLLTVEPADSLWPMYISPETGELQVWREGRVRGCYALPPTLLSTPL